MFIAAVDAPVGLQRLSDLIDQNSLIPRVGVFLVNLTDQLVEELRCRGPNRA
jgi:hypothetical protein